jgi:uncharacterized protein
LSIFPSELCLFQVFDLMQSRELTEKGLYIRFYEELNDFLPYNRKKTEYPVSFRDEPSVKHVIEAEGVSHAEVDMILVNGKPVTFGEKVHDGDRISVYPVFESFDISAVSPLRPRPLRETRIVCDVHLGKLARYLRMLGIDTLYRNDYSDDELVRISVQDKRTLLTRDRRILMRKDLERGYWLRSQHIMEQLREVVDRLDLSASLSIFSRCTFCNGVLEQISAEIVSEKYPTHHFFEGTMFFRCGDCDHIFWNGTHTERFREKIMGVL